MATDFESILVSVDEVLDADPEGKKIAGEIRRKTLAEALAIPKIIAEAATRGTTLTWKEARVIYGTGANLPDDGIPWKDEEAYPDQVVQGPRALTIPEAPADSYWYDDPTQARFLDHYIRAKSALGAAMHGALLITGPSGAGKTQSVGVAVDRLNTAGMKLTLHKFDCAATTDAGKWMGRREVDKTGTRFYESDLMKAIQAPGSVVLFDEVNRLHPTLTNLIHPLLDGSRALHISDMNVTVPVDPSVVFIATANIGSGFGGVHRFDQAFRERFGYTLERDFPPEEDEVNVLVRNTGCDADAAQVLVDVAAKTRQMYATGDLRSPISTRTLVGAAWLVASGFTEREALELTALPLYDSGADGSVGQETDRTKVRAIVEGRSR